MVFPTIHKAAEINIPFCSSVSSVRTMTQGLAGWLAKQLNPVFELLCRRAVLSASCLVGELSCRGTVLSSTCPVGTLSCRQTVLSANCPVSKLSCRQTVCRQTVLLQTVRLQSAHVLTPLQGLILIEIKKILLLRSTETIAPKRKRNAELNIQFIGKVYKITLSFESLHHFVIKHSFNESNYFHC